MPDMVFGAARATDGLCYVYIVPAAIVINGHGPTGYGVAQSDLDDLDQIAGPYDDLETARVEAVRIAQRYTKERGLSLDVVNDPQG